MNSRHDHSAAQREQMRGNSRAYPVYPVKPAGSPLHLGLVALQRTAGNAAVTRFLRDCTSEYRLPVVHRCGPTPCDCPEEAKTHAVQRQKKAPTKESKKTKKDRCINEPTNDAKAQCHFSSEQLNLVRIVKEHALRRCVKSIAAINMPGNEDTVKKIVKDYFGIDVRLSEKTKRRFINTIKTISEKLEHTAIECRTCQDERCNSGAIAYADDTLTFLGLCPQFFNSELNKVYLTPRYLIHEAGHLAKLDENTNLREEFYCFQGATKEEKCGVPDAIHNVDAWSYFIEDLAYTI